MTVLGFEERPLSRSLFHLMSRSHYLALRVNHGANQQILDHETRNISFRSCEGKTTNLDDHHGLVEKSS
jgi:hypothetical protein